MNRLTPILLLALFVACSTTEPEPSPSPQPSVNVQRTAAFVRASAHLGVYTALRNDPARVPQWTRAALAVQESAAAGKLSTADLRAVFAASGQFEWEPAVRPALDLYEVYAAKEVGPNADKTVYLKPVAEALAEGIRRGIDGRTP